MALIYKETVRKEIERRCICENTEISRKRLNRVIIEPSKRWQPVEGLEEEISNFLDKKDAENHGRWYEEDIFECARHFAKWGAEHLKR